MPLASSIPFLLLIVSYLNLIILLLPFLQDLHSNYSSEFANCMLQPFPWSWSTQFSTQAHLYSMQNPKARVNQHFFLIPFTFELLKQFLYLHLYPF